MLTYTRISFLQRHDAALTRLLCRCVYSFWMEAFRRSTESHLIIGGLLIVLVLGGGLAWLLFGRTVALIAGGIMVGGMILLAVMAGAPFARIVGTGRLTTVTLAPRASLRW